MAVWSQYSKNSLNLKVNNIWRYIWMECAHIELNIYIHMMRAHQQCCVENWRMAKIKCWGNGKKNNIGAWTIYDSFECFALNMHKLTNRMWKMLPTQKASFIHFSSTNYSCLFREHKCCNQNMYIQRCTRRIKRSNLVSIWNFHSTLDVFTGTINDCNPNLFRRP